MHELSVADSLLRAVLRTLETGRFSRAKEIRVEIGELALIGHEQLRGAIELLAEGTLAEGAHVSITVAGGVVECPSCGFRGKPKKLGDSGFQHTPFILQCPNCDGPVRIVGGDEITVKDIVAEVGDS